LTLGGGERRAPGDVVIAVYPQIKENARESRAFLGRVVRFLAGEARSLVTQICARMPSGSYLTTSDGTTNEERRKAEETYADTDGVHYYARDPADIASFFDGLEWVEPGFVSVSQWRPDVSPEDKVGNVRPIASPSPVGQYGGVARKP
jgi:hypothetical protein